jgi:hypothetical protein
MSPRMFRYPENTLTDDRQLHYSQRRKQERRDQDFEHLVMVGVSEYLPKRLALLRALYERVRDAEEQSIESQLEVEAAAEAPAPNEALRVGSAKAQQAALHRLSVLEQKLHDRCVAFFASLGDDD